MQVNLSKRALSCETNLRKSGSALTKRCRSRESNGGRGRGGSPTVEGEDRDGGSGRVEDG